MGSLGEPGEHVVGFDDEQGGEVCSSPVVSGLAGYDAGDLVSSGARPGLAGTGWLVLAEITESG